MDPNGNDEPDPNEPTPKSIREVELSGSEARAKLAELMAGMNIDSAPASSNKPKKEYKFWSTQPVPQMDSVVDDQGPRSGAAIEAKSIAQIPKHPYNLIDSFEWSDVDVTNDAQLEEAYQLLNENYVEDGDAMFRFDYSREFLRWALLPPGWHPSWHIGVRVKSNRKLVAFITAVPASISVYDNIIRMVEINFLCVHKKLRSKRLAPVLIREITRRVNLQGIWQAAYTAGAVLPRPVSSSRYYHRSLNPKKLIEVGFSRLQPRMTMTRTMKLYAVKPQTSVPGIRQMKTEDTTAACALLMKYLDQFDMHVDMTVEEFCHWLLPRKNVIYSYVVEDPATREITDMVSFYSLPSSIIKHPIHKKLHAAYAYCTAALKTPLTALMQDALVLARQNGFDVFNALELGCNAAFFKELKFHVGDGELHYYLYNWKCHPISKEMNSLVLL